MQSRHTKIILGIIAIAIVFAIGYSFKQTDYQDTKTTDTELFALKANCSEKANEFASSHSVNTDLMVEKWEIERNIWNPKLQSCYAEFMIFSAFSLDTSLGSNSNAIYDVLSGEQVIGIVWLKGDYSDALEWQQKISEQKSQYEKKSKEIFGSSSELPI